MSQVIVYTNEFGGVAVCVPTGELPIEQVLAKDVPQDQQSFVVDYHTLPHDDHDFFDAWEHTKGIVSINMNKARDITKRRLREERVPLLSAQDGLFQRALETGASTASIVAEKQRLRDITKLADAASALHELRSLKASN